MSLHVFQCSRVFSLHSSHACVYMCKCNHPHSRLFPPTLGRMVSGEDGVSFGFGCGGAGRAYNQDKENVQVKVGGGNSEGGDGAKISLGEGKAIVIRIETATS